MVLHVSVVEDKILINNVHSDTEHLGYVCVISLCMVVYAFILKSRVKHLWLSFMISGNLYRVKRYACVRDELYFLPMKEGSRSVTTAPVENIGYRPNVLALVGANQ